jgi:hypothetical protein
MKINMTDKQSSKRLLEDLIRKIRLHRGVHDVHLDKNRALLNFLKVFNIVSSSIITLVIFADFGLIKVIFPNLNNFWVMLVVGFISFFLFLLNSIINSFNIDHCEFEHGRAIELLSDLLRDIRKIDFESIEDKSKELLINQFNDRYMQITFSTINIGGRKFEKANAIYLKRQARKLAIKENPFQNSIQIRQLAIQKVKEYQKIEKEFY